MDPQHFFVWVSTQDWFKSLPYLCTGASLLRAFLPKELFNAVPWIKWFIDLVALNVANSKNAK